MRILWIFQLIVEQKSVSVSKSNKHTRDIRRSDIGRPFFEHFRAFVMAWLLTTIISQKRDNGLWILFIYETLENNMKMEELCAQLKLSVTSIKEPFNGVRCTAAHYFHLEGMYLSPLYLWWPKQKLCHLPVQWSCRNALLSPYQCLFISTSISIICGSLLLEKKNRYRKW